MTGGEQKTTPEQGEASASATPTWRDVWQVPALLAGTGLLVAGLVAVMASKPSEDLNPAIAEAQELIDDEKHVEAITVLNEDVYPRLEQGLVTPDQTRQYHLLLSRAIYLGARGKGITRPENFQSVIDGYVEAQRANATLEPRDLEYLAESNIELGRLKIALEHAERLPNKENERLVKLLRKIVTSALSPKGDAAPDLELASELVARMLADAQLSDADRLWATTRQSELRIADGQYEPAIRGILQQMQRLGEGFEREKGELHLLLGRAYLKEAASGFGGVEADPSAGGGINTQAVELRAQAAKSFMRAREPLMNTEFAPEVDYWLGYVAEVTGDAESARESYAMVASGPSGPWRIKALLGLGEAASALGERDESLAAFEELVNLAVLTRRPGGSVEIPGEGASGGSGGHDDTEHGATSGAKEGAKAGAPEDHAATSGEGHSAEGAADAKAGEAHGGEAKPEGHSDSKGESSAGGKHGEAEGGEHGGASGPREAVRLEWPKELPFERVSTSLIARARERYDAGETENALRYAELAERMWGVDKAPADVHLMIAEARKRAADEVVEAAIDRGGAVISLAELDPSTRKLVREHLIKSAQAYRSHAAKVVLADSGNYAESLWLAADTFDRAGDQDQAIATFLQYQNDFPSDPRRAEAKFRLAGAYQARGDYELAAKAYRELIDERDTGQGGSSVYADQAYVPLAKTLIADMEPANDDEIERLLQLVVSGNVADVDSPIFRDALFELGRYHADKGEHERAIERLEEAVARFPDHPQTMAARYQLADAYRKNADQLAVKLAEAMPDVERRKLEDLKVERLNKASGLFEQTRRTFEAIDPARRTTLDDLYLRNSYFYLGDCAYELRDFDTAIRLYTAARDRFPQDPASLVAMIQIVNANLEMNNKRAAITANERARRFFKSLPETVWDDPNLPMGRADWERWLDSTDELARVATEGDPPQAGEMNRHE